MKRTYFVPLLVMAGFFLVSGVLGFTAAVLMERLNQKMDALFEREYEKTGNYDILYEEALKLRHELSFRENQHMFFHGGVGITMAIILLWWALDRRRLVLRLRQASAQQDKLSP